MSAGAEGASRGGGSEPPPPPPPPPPEQQQPPQQQQPPRAYTVSPQPTIVAAVRDALGMSRVTSHITVAALYKLIQVKLPGALRFPPDHDRAGQVLAWSAGRVPNGALFIAAAQYFVECTAAGVAPHDGRPPPAARGAVGGGAGATAAAAAAVGGGGAALGGGGGGGGGGPPGESAADRYVRVALAHTSARSLETIVRQMKATRGSDAPLCATMGATRDLAQSVYATQPGEFPAASGAETLVAILEAEEMIPVEHDREELAAVIEEARRREIFLKRNRVARASCQRFFFKQKSTPAWITVLADVNSRLIMKMSPAGELILEAHTVGGRAPPWPWEHSPPVQDHMGTARRVGCRHACTAPFL